MKSYVLAVLLILFSIVFFRQVPAGGFGVSHVLYPTLGALCILGAVICVGWEIFNLREPDKHG